MKKRMTATRVEGLEPRRLFSAVPTPAHVVIVIEENRAFNNIIGSPSAPYINSLASAGALFTDSHGLTHPSQPNYIALFSGSQQGVTDNTVPATLLNAPNLGSQLIAKGLTFGGYSEDLPSVGSLAITSGKYARKHNPWSDFSTVPAADNMPFTSFPTDFTTLPTVSFVVPNLDNDMHDGTINQGDVWLQQHLGAYSTWAKNNNSLLIYTCDEDDRSNPSNQIPSFIYGANVIPGQYAETITHYNVLRTLEDMYGLAPLGNAATAAPITDIWQPGAIGNRITLTQDQDQAHIDWTVNGGPITQININDPAGLTLNGSLSGANDQIYLDYGNGVPLPNKLNLNGVFTLNNLATTGNPLANTTIDLGRSTLFINYGAPANDPVGLIRGYLQTGYNNGLWTGTSATGSIRSSAAAATTNHSTAIGYVDSTDNLVSGLPANTLQLSYTLFGDTGLQAPTGYAVGFTDFMRLTQHYTTTNATWGRGDFNYDGTVDSTDFSLLTATYGVTLPPPPPPAASPAANSTTTSNPSDVSQKTKATPHTKKKAIAVRDRHTK